MVRKMPAPRNAVEFSRPARPAAPTVDGDNLPWESVESDTIERIAYISDRGDLLVRFASGGDYIYREVEPELVAKLRKPHPWRVVGDEIKAHPFEKLGSIRTRPLKKRTKKV